MIYKIQNKVDGKFYIGYTGGTLSGRFSQHKYNSKRDNTYLYKAMRHHGIENFEITLLEECDNSKNREREVHWIAELNPHYNMTTGGDGGDTSSSPNWKQGMGKRRSYAGEGNPMYGKPSAFKGKSHTKESLDKQSKNLKDAWNRSDRSARGAKIAGSRNGMFNKTPKNAKKIFFNDVMYNSLNEASKATGHCGKFLKKNGIIYDAK